MKKLSMFLLAVLLLLCASAVAAAQTEEELIRERLMLDKPNYESPVLWEDPSSTSVFISKHYKISTKYKPENLVEIDRKYSANGVRLREDCYESMLLMAKDMEAEGLVLYIKSGFRTNSKRGGPNSLWFAWPGHTEHQTGLAFDLRKKGKTYPTLGGYKYEQTKEFAWLCDNAYRYGFILSYPKDKSDITGFGFEPWHWRFVGIDIATDMREKGFATYHEYWALHLYSSVMTKANDPIDAGGTGNPIDTNDTGQVRMDTLVTMQRI